ncbi:MAG: DNA polymerase III subunit delta [bacterium]
MGRVVLGKMIILIYGEDNYRLKQKLNDLIGAYKTKNKSGMDLACFEDGFDVDELRNRVESISMFGEKKLIILKNIFKKDFEDDFFKYAKKKKLKNNQDVIVILYQEGKLAVSGIKRKINMLEEFKPLTGNNLSGWIEREVKNRGGKISCGATQRLAFFVGADLWRMNGELNKLISYKGDAEITGKDIDLMIGSKIENNIFKTLDALSCRDKKTAFRLLHEHINQGENEIYLLTMFIYQLRNLIRIKSLLDTGVAGYALNQKSGLHPFVVQKSVWVLRNFSLDQLKKIYRDLLDVDIKLKSGRIDAPTAFDLLIATV